MSGTQIRMVILGSGPGGYVAALRAAQLGATVTLVEKDLVGGYLPQPGLHTHQVPARERGIAGPGARR